MRKTLYMDSFIYLIVLRKHKSLSYTTKYKNVNDGVYDDITNDGIRYGVISYCKEYIIPKDDWKDKKIRRYCKLHRHKITTNGVCEVKHDCEGYNVACWQKKMKT